MKALLSVWLWLFVVLSVALLFIGERAMRAIRAAGVAAALALCFVGAAAHAQPALYNCKSPGSQCAAANFNANAGANARAYFMHTSARFYLDDSGLRYFKEDGGGVTTFQGTSLQSTSFISTVTSGATAFQIQTNGALLDLGTGPNDYLKSDGVSITTPTNIVAGSVFAPTHVWSANGLPTCNAANEGSVTRQGGASLGARTRLCVCTSDGGGTPVYAWVNLLSGVQGDTTSCPSSTATLTSVKSFDAPSITPGGFTDFPVTVTGGIAVGDNCIVNGDGTYPAGFHAVCFVADSGTVTVRGICDNAGTACDPPPMNWRVRVFRN